EVAADFMCDAIRNSYEMNCPLKLKNASVKVSWWNKELSKLRLKARRLFNRARNINTPETWERYRDSQRVYRKAIVKARRIGWRNFCTNIESAPEASRLCRILCKDNNQQWNCLKLPCGRFTESTKETLSHLMEVHFPGFQETLPVSVCRHRPRAAYKPRAWSLAAEVVYPQTVEWALGSFEPYKAPGPDGIQLILLQEGLKVMLGQLTKVFRASIALR
ncbi:lian-aa1 retrotransposon protein, partial [Lasius niger]